MTSTKDSTPTASGTPSSSPTQVPVSAPLPTPGILPAYPKVLVYNGAKYPFDPHRIVFSDPERTSHGGFVVKQQYQLRDEKAGINELVPILLQTPVMKTTFGLSEKEQEGQIRAQIDLNFGSRVADKEVQAFYDVLKLWDDIILFTAMKRKTTWFKDSNITKDILTYLYKPLVRKNVRQKDGREFPDCFRVRVPKKFGRYETVVYDHTKAEVTLDYVKGDSSLQALVQQSGIWFSPTMWTSSCRAIQVKLAKDQRLNGYSFVEEEGATPGGHQIHNFD